MTELNINLDILSKTPWQYPVTSTLNSPPSHSSGSRYLIGSTASGTWSGKSGQIATSYNNDWLYDSPSEGWSTVDNTTGELLYYNGSNWYSEGINKLNGSTPSVKENGTVFLETSTDTLYYYDSTRSKYLSSKRYIYDFSARSSTISGTYLACYGSLTPTASTNYYFVPFDITIIGYVASTTTAVNSNIVIVDNSGSTVLTCTYSNSTLYNTVLTTNINVNSDQTLRAIVGANQAAITNPIVEIIYCRRI